VSFPVAIIGVSGFGATHYEDLLEYAAAGGVRLAAATIINQEEESKKCGELRRLGCEIFGDYRAMFGAWRGRLNLCVIPTGIHQHAPMTLAALEAGSHVLVEKPAAGSIQEVDAMIQAEKQTGKFVAVGFQHIYLPEVRAMKQALLDGLIGEIRAIKCFGLWPRSDSYYTRNRWAGRLRIGGNWVLDAPFNNGFAHFLNLMGFLAGTEIDGSATPERLQAELYRAREIESADTACLRVETETGVPLLLWLTHSCREEFGPVIEVRGSRGALTWSENGILHRTPSGEILPFRTASDHTAKRRHLFDAVLGRARGDGNFICGLPIARNQTLCANGAFESSPVISLDAAFLSTVGTPPERLTCVEGIEDLCRQAFKSERLWSEMEVPWARAGNAVNLTGYERFEGGLCYASARPAELS